MLYPTAIEIVENDIRAAAVKGARDPEAEAARSTSNQNYLAGEVFVFHAIAPGRDVIRDSG
jgi:hypothetical protein